MLATVRVIVPVFLAVPGKMCKIVPGKYPLDWVDGFIEQIRPYAFVREYDRLLILLPNQSYKLNDTGVKLLKPLLEGKTMKAVIGDKPLPEKISKDLFEFFTGVVAMFKGCLGEGRFRPEVEQVKYVRPYNKLPVLSEMALTYRCNLKCTFCYAGCNRDNSPDILTAEKIKKILNVVRQDAQVPSISFTGGEPTLRDDLPCLVEMAVSTGLRVNLVSNGTLVTKQLAKDLKQAGLSSAQISIEGPNKEIHDLLTGVDGSFESSIRGISNLSEQGVNVHHNTTLTAPNVEYAVDMIDLAKELDIDRLSMNMIIPSEWILKNKPELVLKYSQIGQTVLKVKNAARNEGIRFMWYSPTPYCIFNPIAVNLGNKGCAACDGLLSIDPQGQVIPCSSFFKPVGSVLDDDFMKIWENKISIDIRDKSLAPENCKTCSEFELCEGACPLYWCVMGADELNNKKAYEWSLKND